MERKTQRTQRTVSTQRTDTKDIRERRRHNRRIRKLKVLLRRTAAVVILIGMIITAVLLLRGCVRADRATRREESVPVPTVSTANDTSQMTWVKHDNPDLEELEFPFNQMSADWGAGDIDGWWRYAIPEKYTKIGGYLPDLVQVYTYCLCRQQGIRYPLVLALIEVESGYQYDAASSAGDIGYMQVNYKWQQDKMEGLKEKALYNPYTNIQVGIRYLVELSESFDTEAGVLTAYKYGPSGARSRCFNDPEITSEYAEKVLAAAERIEGELEHRESHMDTIRIEPGGAEDGE